MGRTRRYDLIAPLLPPHPCCTLARGGMRVRARSRRGSCAGAGQAPTFWEDYNKGDLGPLGLSKWVPEDHPPSHPNCKLHDIDCDELFPWGKVRRRHPAPRRAAAPDAAGGGS